MEITSPPDPRTHLRASSNPSPALRPHLTPFRSLLTTIAALLCLALPLAAQSPPPQLPPNNATLDFGPVFTGQPTIQWIKITQSSPSASVVVTSSTPGTPYLATLVEDTGFGHGQPPALRFLDLSHRHLPQLLARHPLHPAIHRPRNRLHHPHPAPHRQPLHALPHRHRPPHHRPSAHPHHAGLRLHPYPQHQRAHYSSPSPTSIPPATSINLGNPTTSGDFAAITTPPTGGPICGGPLAYTASCFLQIAFVPTTTGPLTGTLNLQAGPLTATAQLTGTATAAPASP